MCVKNVILFHCGHTRALSYVCKHPDMETCPDTKRNLIPATGGTGLEALNHKIMWTCVFKCKQGVAAHDELIDIAREDASKVKANIEHQHEILSVLSPTSTPGSDGESNYGHKATADI